MSVVRENAMSSNNRKKDIQEGAGREEGREEKKENNKIIGIHCNLKKERKTFKYSKNLRDYICIVINKEEHMKKCNKTFESIVEHTNLQEENRNTGCTMHQNIQMTSK